MINKTHPKFDEYLRKCKALAKEEEAEIEKNEKSKKRNVCAFDGDATPIHKKYAKKLKELQKEYSFLFKED